MTSISRENLARALEWLGLPERAAEDDDNIEHMDLLGDVMVKYFVRNQKYKGTWQQYGALSQLVRAAQKIDRLMAVWWYDIDEDRAPLTEEDLDDAQDAINHLLFFMRCARAGNLTGVLPNRPDIDSKAFGILTDEIFSGQVVEQTGPITPEMIEKLGGAKFLPHLPVKDGPQLRLLPVSNDPMLPGMADDE